LTEINALVTPLEKHSPAGDTGNEPVFFFWDLKVPKEVEPISSARETTWRSLAFQSFEPNR
jgi:hypothetical protein